MPAGAQRRLVEQVVDEQRDVRIADERTGAQVDEIDRIGRRVARIVATVARILVRQQILALARILIVAAQIIIVEIILDTGRDRPGRTAEGIALADDDAVFAELGGAGIFRIGIRSEEHTSELQSLMRISYAVFCLKKKN